MGQPGKWTKQEWSLHLAADRCGTISHRPCAQGVWAIVLAEMKPFSRPIDAPKKKRPHQAHSCGKWQRLEVRDVASSPWLRVQEIDFATPARPHGGVRWMVVRRKQAAIVAPRLADGRFLLVHQERPAVEDTLWEFPAGQVDVPNADGEEIAATARRELEEETGHRLPPGGGRLIPLGLFFSSAGFTDERGHLFLAESVEALPDPQPLGEGSEVIHEVRKVTARELREMIAAGEVRDANTLACFARLTALGLL